MMTAATGQLCARARFWASLRVDGELSELESALLDAHLGRCADCSAYATGVAGVTAALRNAPLVAVAPRVIEARARRGNARGAGGSRRWPRQRERLARWHDDDRRAQRGGRLDRRDARPAAPPAPHLAAEPARGSARHLARALLARSRAAPKRGLLREARGPTVTSAARPARP